jgi:hypothetical protein
MKRRLSLLLLAAALAGTAIAQPSVYYLFKHKVSGKTICEPEAPDSNWIKVGGAFQDPNCTIPQPQ